MISMFVRQTSLLIVLVLLTAWAQAASPAGVPNFYRVNQGIFRGGQPSVQGLRNLAKLGVKTIVDLRASTEQSDWEAKQVKSLGMQYVHVPFHAHLPPTQGEIERAFSVFENGSQWPIFIHCHGGRDRTGMIVACYRISHDGW